MKEKLLPTVEEKEEAARRIRVILEMDKDPDAAADVLRDVLNEYVPGIEPSYAQRLSPKGEIRFLENEALPRFLIDMMGTEIFEGHSGRKLRNIMLKKLLKRKSARLKNLVTSSKWSDYKEGKKKFDDSAAEKAFKELCDPKKTHWIPGGSFARKFVEVFGFPTIFEGISSEMQPGRVEEVIPRTPYYELTNFQQNMKEQILQILERNAGNRRSIVSLPTGAGKTKTVAEAIIDFWKKRTTNGHGQNRFVIWIAQNDELCEQAVACFKQIWEEKGESGINLNIFRSWKGRGLPYSDEEGIIIAGIDQLNSILKKSKDENRSELNRISDDDLLGAIFIDEAHRSWAPKYRNVLKKIGISTKPTSLDHVPLIGLTATPERTADGETEKLRALYGNERIYPRQEFEPHEDDIGRPFDASWASLKTMKSNLTKQGFLAEGVYHYENPGKPFEMTPQETSSFEETNKFDPSLMYRIGSDNIRNDITYRVLKKWIESEYRQILFFGVNINQALLMSRFLEDDGIKSATITANTRYGARKSFVRMFREGNIQVLCNYEVLATGFDVPKIDTIVIARPTNSRIVYQQMVGRGLRGPRFNGTKTCDIITIEDEITKADHEPIKLGYMEYKKDLEMMQ